MKHEFEVVSHSQFRHLQVFLVHLLSRTPHLHRDLEIGLILDGEVDVRLGQQVSHLKKDDLYLINSMDAHEFITEGNGVLVLAIQVSPKLLEPFLPDAARVRYRVRPSLRPLFEDRPADYDELLRLCRELALHYHRQDPQYELHCFSLIVTLLYRLSVRLSSERMREEDYLPMKRRTDRIVAVTDYIDRNFSRKLLLEEIAEQQGLTMTYLSHLFRDAMGLSFQDYLKEKRFEHAFHQIVSTDRSVLDISLDSGFSDVRYLIRVFQSKFGCTPKEYRKRMQKLPRQPGPVSESLQYFLTPGEVTALLG